MKAKFRVILFLFIGILFSFHPSPSTFKKKAQIVLCVDFSKSAQRISDAVKHNFWEFYTEFESKYPDTKLELAIVGFSSKVFGKKDNYVKILLDFKDDPADYFEYVNRKILTSSLSENKIGTALNVAVNDLNWDDNPSVKKQIYTIGNGPIRDAYVLAKKACKKAKKKNILINVLYVFHKKKDGAFGYWKHLTELSGGTIKTIVTRFLNEKVGGKIHANFQEMTIENEFINSTYIPINSSGKFELEKVKMLDFYSKNLGFKVSGNRAIYRVSRYNQKKRFSWDLVDLYESDKANFNKISKSDLPLYMKNMSDQEIQNVLKLKSKERKESFKTISELHRSNELIRANSAKKPAYKLDLSSTILKTFSESGN